MRIAITGSSKLAAHLINTIDAEWESFRITQNRISAPMNAQHCDVFINQAHLNWDQINVLEEFYDAWKDDDTKTIINISSRAAQPNISKGYRYAAQKAALNHMSNNMIYNSEKKCRICTLNLGLIEHSEISSLTYEDISSIIKFILENKHLEFSEVTVSHRENYQKVQEEKRRLYGN